MKIYYRENHPGYYFWTRKENGLWSLHLELPDMDTFQLCQCSIGYEEEPKVYENSKEVSKEYTKIFDTYYNKKNNREKLYSVIKSVFNTTDEELDKIYNRDTKVYVITKKYIDKYKKDHKCYNRDFVWHFSSLYQDVKYYLYEFKWDEKRIIKYINERTIPNMLYPDDTMVDIFSECHPTKYSLLYEFYNCNDEEEAIMDKAVELYPEKENIDKAYYYFIEERRKLYEYGRRKHI